MTIAVDFDGVIHAYSDGWADGTIYDDPLPGAIQGLGVLMETDAVFIHTSREPEQVGPWLERYGFDVTIDDRCGRCLGGPDPEETDEFFRPTGRVWHVTTCRVCRGSGRLTFWNETGQLLVTNRKLPARLYLDDRAILFTSWDQALADIQGWDHDR